MRTDEITDYFTRYFGKDKNGVLIPKDGTFDYQNLFNKLCMAQKFDRPDLVFVDQEEKKFYLFEHFKFDSSRRKSGKGSESERKVADAERLIKESIRETSKSSESLCVIPWDVKTSIGFYCSSLKYAFEKHEKKVDAYKHRVLEELGGNQKDWNFFMTFIIEDASRFGTLTSDGEMLFPVFIREFMEKFRQQNKVDCLICSSTYGKNKQTWSLSKQDQFSADIKSHERNISDIEIEYINPPEIALVIYAEDSEPAS